MIIVKGFESALNLMQFDILIIGSSARQRIENFSIALIGKDDVDEHAQKGIRQRN